MTRVVENQEKLLKNFKEEFYQKHPKGYELFEIDLDDVIRQQAEYIVKLEMQLAEMTDKWEYLREEMYDNKSFQDEL